MAEADRTAVIAIAGSSGLIGSALAAALRAADHTVWRIVRRAPANSEELHWNPQSGEFDADALSDVDAALADATAWWREHGARALDESGLSCERNLVRYVRARRPVAVRLDESVTPEQTRYLRGLCDLAGHTVDFSAGAVLRGLLDITLESGEELTRRAADFAKVRWLSRETPPTHAFLEHGVSVDPRPLTQHGDVELPRWLLEQSVAITNHRYGNVAAGPKPACPGLGDAATPRA